MNISKELTQEMIDRYIKDNGHHCLFCGSANIDLIEDPNVDRLERTEKVACENCGKTWINNVVLKVTGVSMLDDEIEVCNNANKIIDRIKIGRYTTIRPKTPSATDSKN